MFGKLEGMAYVYAFMQNDLTYWRSLNVTNCGFNDKHKTKLKMEFLFFRLNNVFSKREKIYAFIKRFSQIKRSIRFNYCSRFVYWVHDKRVQFSIISFQCNL